MFYIKQNDRGDCGFTLVKMLLANLNKDKNYLYLSSPKRKNENFSYFELKEIANEYGLSLAGFKVNDKQELRKATLLPLIISLFTSNGKKHAIYVYKIKRGFIYYYDSNKGKKKEKIDEIISRWDGTGLSYISFKPTKCPIKYKSLINKKERFLLLGLQILGSLSLFTGVFFLSDQYNFVIPIICFTCFILFEVLFRSYMMRLFQVMDNRVIGLGKIKKDCYVSLFYSYEPYKEKEITLSTSLIYSVIVVSALIALLAFNGYQNLYYIISSLVFAIVLAFVIDPLLDKDKNQISIDERGIHFVSNLEGLINFMNKIHAKSYKHGLFALAIKYLCVFGELLIILLVMVSLGKIQLTYVVFYLCVNYLLTNSLRDIFAYYRRRKEYDSYKAKLFNNFIND